MKLRTLIICTSVLFGGCATVHQSYAPDGRVSYNLNCSGLARGWDKCFQAAGDICKEAGFDVLDRSDEPSSTVGGSYSGNRGGMFGAQTSERSMAVACKRPAP